MVGLSPASAFVTLHGALPACLPACRDIAYMEDLLRLVRERHVAAPAPIEQRWTAGSSAGMSPASGPPGSLHSWVGIIMYLPEDERQREEVTRRWGAPRYCKVPSACLFVGLQRASVRGVEPAVGLRFSQRCWLRRFVPPCHARSSRRVCT